MNDLAPYAIVIVHLSDEDGGGYYGFVPDLPGCASDGESRQEALENTEDALKEWLYEQNLRGVEIPSPGAASQEAIDRERKLLEAIKSLAEYRESADEQIVQLKRQLSELIAVLKDDTGRPPAKFSVLDLQRSGKKRLAH